MTLIEQLRSLSSLPFPGGGETSLRHHALAEISRSCLSLGRLAEAHFDALAILAEAGRTPASGAIYGVWASEIPHKPLSFQGKRLSGTKRFCSGAGLVDRALVSTTMPTHLLLDIDLKKNADTLTFDSSDWITQAFAETRTCTVTFRDTPVADSDVIGEPHWYLDRPGFWSGAVGPASCWAGGALGLVDWALLQKREDPHTLAHLGALQADAWLLRSTLAQAGLEIDEHPHDAVANHKLALTVRHVIETACADILTRIGRAYGPHPLAFDALISRRYAEVELYIRQCHGERDLASLGSLRLLP